MQRIAIMQGRLLPPVNGCIQCFPVEGWADEFALAAETELNAIEWIYDLHGAQSNPIATDDGIAQMTAFERRFGIEVVSLCADYFMDCPLVDAAGERDSNAVARLHWLISRCRQAGIARIVLPFVDSSALSTQAQMTSAATILREVAGLCQKERVEIHLETSLTPHVFAGFLEELPVSTLKVNYDCGNSASLGYDFREEFAAYGTRIGSVHIKDRVRGGGTVPLGQGSAELQGIVSALRALSYSGDFVLQVARGESGQELECARHNRSLLFTYLEEAAAARQG